MVEEFVLTGISCKLNWDPIVHPNQVVHPILAWHPNLLFQMSNYICWLCDKKEERKFELKHHMSSVHDRLKIICVWCEGKELSFRKAVDLKVHMKSNHKSIMRDAPTDTFGEPNCFWLAKHPKDYLKLVKPTPRDNAEAKFLRRALERWWPSVGNKSSRSLSEWKEGWSSVPLVSPLPSPVLDYKETPSASRLAIHELTISSTEVTTLLYEEFSNKLIWHKVTVKPKIMSAQKDRDSFLRRLDQVRPYHGVVPTSLGRPLEGDRLEFAKSRISGKLRVNVDYFDKIFKVERTGFSECKGDEEESQEPAKKKMKTDLSEAALTESKKKPVFPLDILLPRPDRPQVDKPSVPSTMPKPDQPKIDEPSVPSTLPKPDQPQVDKPSVPSTLPNPDQPKIDESSVPSTLTKPDQPKIDRPSVPPTLPELEQPKPEQPLGVSTISSSLDTANVTESVMESANSTARNQTFKPTIDLTEYPTLNQHNSTSIVESPFPQPSPAHDQSIWISPDDLSQLVIIANADQKHAKDHSYPHVAKVDERGDSYTIDPPENSTEYVPTPKERLQRPLPVISLHAEILLRYGCMPLLPPARRNWGEEEQIVLPASSPVPCWPPKRWSSLTPDTKLLLWEAVATSLAIKDGLELNRGEIIDTYNFLALPGSSDPNLQTNLQSARYYNYKAVRDICLGKSKSNDVITMLDAASSCSRQTISASVILEQMGLTLEFKKHESEWLTPAK